jgi:hypothetical protein
MKHRSLRSYPRKYTAQKYAYINRREAQIKMLPFGDLGDPRVQGACISTGFREMMMKSCLLVAVGGCRIDTSVAPSQGRRAFGRQLGNQHLEDATLIDEESGNVYMSRCCLGNEDRDKSSK